ncbi:MAG: translocation/assembly module TamB domain-containing protein [Myxococcales bacterium]
MGRRIGRGVAIGFAVVVGLVLLAIVGAVVWLHTGGGARTLGREVTKQAQEAIQGRLDVASIDVTGFLRVCADGVHLSDPDGNEVLRAERVCVHVDPIALKAHKVNVSELRLIRPWIDVASVTGPDGKPTTTLSRALAARKPPVTPAEKSGPFAWAIDATGISLEQGSVAIRPAPKEKASLALEGVDLAEGRAHYSADRSAAALSLAGQLLQPARLPVALAVDAKVEGPTDSGKLEVREARLSLGKSSLRASGSLEIATRKGTFELHDVRIEPADVDALLPGKPGPLAGEVRGSATVRLDGQRVAASLRLDAGGGRIAFDGDVVPGAEPQWSVALQLEGVDPAAVARAGPNGKVTGRVEGRGKGIPRFDEHGIYGDLHAKVQLGPARLERMGDVTADLTADVQGRKAFVRAFTATAFGLRLSAHGTAARDAMAMDLVMDAPDLSAVGKAIGSFQKKPTVPLAGSAHLVARVTGSPRQPDAEVHLRVPRFREDGQFAGSGIAIDGNLSGNLKAPAGRLLVSASQLQLGQIGLAQPRVDVELAWPMAHLRVDSAIESGRVRLAGDARIDDDKDGLLLSNFHVSYPENEFNLAHSVRVHFREGETVVEPLDLVGPHGSLRVSAQIRKTTMEAAAVVSRFDLAFLPKFVLPPNLGLAGIVDGNAVVSGRKSRPDFDLQLDVQKASISRTAELPLDAHTHSHLHAGRLVSEGFVRMQGGPDLQFQIDSPIRADPGEAPGTPIKGEISLRGFDLAQLAQHLHIARAQEMGVTGTVALHLVASGTLGIPNATLSVDARDLGTSRLRGVDLRAGLLVEKGRAALDASVAIAREPTAALTMQLPFDLLRAVKERSYLKNTLDRTVEMALSVDKLPLDRLVRAGLLPQGSSGEIGLNVRITGTALAPKVVASAWGESIVAGQIHGLSFQSELSVDKETKFGLGAQANGEAVARADSTFAVSGAEMAQLLRRRGDRQALEPILDRPVSMTIDIPGLVIGRMAQLAGKPDVAAEGRIEGHLKLAGSAASPRLEGRMVVKDVLARQKKLGNAELYVEADGHSALLHVGINPPGGGTFLGHVVLTADLGARALLRQGGSSVMQGSVTGEVNAKKLDLGFASGLIPRMRRAGGTLDASVKVSGVLRKPVPEGEAHLKNALFDVVGQGVFEDIGLDAKFSPKEVVIDRITGSTAGGTFAAILAGSRKTGTGGTDRVEFTGEVHLGDDESVRDRKKADGTPVKKGAVPIRQASEETARVDGEIDLFGDYTNNVLTVNAKIPGANVKVLRLPDKKLPKLEGNPDVFLVHPGEKPHPAGKEPGQVEAEEEARKTATFKMHAQLDVERIYVAAEDFEFPVISHIKFDYDAKHPDAPSAEGVVHAPQGSFSALGRRFTVEDAKITENGGDIANPELDVRARFDSPKYIVNIAVTGTAKKPQLDLTSNPPMDQDAIAFFLATGRTPNEGKATGNGAGIDLQGAATSVVGAMLFGQLRNTMRAILPVDVLTVETQGAQISQASVGKYIGDTIYIGYRQRMNAAQNENTVEGHIEYEIIRDLSAEGTVGDKNQEISVLWTHDF